MKDATIICECGSKMQLELEKENVREFRCNTCQRIKKYRLIAGKWELVKELYNEKF